MGESTKIAWTHHTFNPWIGCEKVSSACKHCYASVDTFARASRARGLELWGKNAARHVTSDDNWKLPLRWNRAAEQAGERRRVFCASLADVFEDRADLVEPRARLLSLIARCTGLDWMLLTKRPENMVRFTREGWGVSWPSHVWAGATVEDNESLDRISHLQGVPASVRFLSVEPLLERIDLSRRLEGIHLCIVGGESGSKARPFLLNWADEIRNACSKTGTAFFFKQAGSNVFVEGVGLLDDEDPAAIDVVRVNLKAKKGGDLSELPEQYRVREMPTEAARG
jgi:protein gp37